MFVTLSTSRSWHHTLAQRIPLDTFSWAAASAASNEARKKLYAYRVSHDLPVWLTWCFTTRAHQKHRDRSGKLKLLTWLVSEAAASTDYHHHRSLTLAATLWNNGEHLNAFTLYFKVTDAAGASPERQVALFLTIRRPILPDVYNTLSLRESTPTQPHPEFDLSHMAEPLDVHFSPKQKEVYSRCIFQTQV